MTTSNPDHATRLRDWAGGQLQLPVGGPQSARRAAFLERVAAAQFCPTPAVDYAERVLVDGGDTSPANLGWQRAQQDIEKQLRSDIEQLAADWFSLSGRVRMRHLEEARSACRPFANLVSRLDTLAPALLLDPAEVTGPAGQLARMIGELFVLAPRRRAERRREMLLELENEADLWESAARALKARHAAWAALQPVFVESILTQKLHDNRARAAKKAYAKSLKQQKAATSEGLRWPWLVAMLVILSLIRSSSCLKQSSPPEPPRFNPRQPIFPPPGDDERWKKDDKQFRENLQKILSRKWRLEDGKLVPAEDSPFPPAVKPGSPPKIDPK